METTLLLMIRVAVNLSSYTISTLTQEEKRNEREEDN